MSSNVSWRSLLQAYVVEDRAPGGYSGYDMVPGWDHIGRLYRNSGSPLELVVTLSDLIHHLLFTEYDHESLQALERTLLLAKQLAHANLHFSVREVFTLLSVLADGQLRTHRIHTACVALAALAHIEATVSELYDKKFWQELISEDCEFSAIAFSLFREIDPCYSIEHLEEYFDLALPDDEIVVGLRGLQRDADRKGLRVPFYQHLEGVLKRRPELEALCRESLGAKFAITAD